MTWDAEAIAELKRYWDSPEAPSATLIASSMSTPEDRISRNAIIGKAHRLGLTKRRAETMARKSHPKHRPVRTEKFKPHVRLPAPPPIEAEPMPEIADDNAIPIAQRRTLDQLEARHCRWPCGRPGTPDFFFCGSPTADFPSVPYCPAHAARAFAGRGKAPDRYPVWGRGRA